MSSSRRGGGGRGSRRSRSRSRSLSPFSVAYENWSRFKQAEKVMLDTLNRKRDIFDKRPEDHPDYPAEWKDFWEMRYRELTAQGKDSDNYDYKSEWIPHWGKRVNELFRLELEDKTEDILRRFGLRNADEPLRGDFAPPPMIEEDPPFAGDFRGSFRGHGPDAVDPWTREHEFRGGRRSPSPMGMGMGYPQHGGRYSRSRSRSPPDHRGRGRRSRSPSWNTDRLSSITDVVNRGRRRRSRSIASVDSITSEEEAELRGPVRIIPVLRRLADLGDVLGSLAPQISATIGRCLTLEECRPGASNILLEDADMACVMDMVREKLTGQLSAGFLEVHFLHPVRIALRHLSRLLEASTKKRPLVPPKLAPPSNPLEEAKNKFKKMVAEQMAEILMQKGGKNVSEFDLRKLVYLTIKDTELDDGTLEMPIKKPSMAETLASFGFTVILRIYPNPPSYFYVYYFYTLLEYEPSCEECFRAWILLCQCKL